MESGQSDHYFFHSDDGSFIRFKKKPFGKWGDKEMLPLHFVVPPHIVFDSTQENASGKFDWIPDEVMMQIIHYLMPTTLSNNNAEFVTFRMICKRFYILAAFRIESIESSFFKFVGNPIQLSKDWLIHPDFIENTVVIKNVAASLGRNNLCYLKFLRHFVNLKRISFPSFVSGLYCSVIPILSLHPKSNLMSSISQFPNIQTIHIDKDTSSEGLWYYDNFTMGESPFVKSTMSFFDCTNSANLGDSVLNKTQLFSSHVSVDVRCKSRKRPIVLPTSPVATLLTITFDQMDCVQDENSQFVFPSRGTRQYYFLRPIPADFPKLEKIQLCFAQEVPINFINSIIFGLINPNPCMADAKALKILEFHFENNEINDDLLHHITNLVQNQPKLFAWYSFEIQTNARNYSTDHQHFASFAKTLDPIYHLSIQTKQILSSEQACIGAYSLSFKRTGLFSIPNSLPWRLFQNLYNLDLSENRLANLPDSLDQLTKLNSLNLNNNKLTCLPSVVIRLTTLRMLKLKLNRIRSLPLALLQAKLKIHADDGIEWI